MNKKEVKQFVTENEVLTIKADKSSSNPLMQDINKLLNKLGNDSAGLPYYVVYPAGGGEPVVFDGLITKGRILRELKKAVQAGGPASKQTAAASK